MPWLTLIAQTMPPQADCKGSSSVGAATRFGFLTVLFLREPG